MAFGDAESSALEDGELELVRPSEQWFDGWMSACHHPLTHRLEPQAAVINRHDLLDLMIRKPNGYSPGDAAQGVYPSVHWWMHWRGERAVVPVAGSISLRTGDDDNMRRFVGNVGYWVAPPARGRRFAERSLRLIVPIARCWGMLDLWITCNPDNYASRRTLQRLGCELIGIHEIPPGHDLRIAHGEYEKCSYRLKL